MKLLPMPMSVPETRAKGRQLRKRLQKTSLAELIDGEIRHVHAWEQLEDPVIRRLSRNTTIVFSDDELRQYFSDTYYAILGKDLREYRDG